VTPNIAAATAFLAAMKNKDLSQAPLAENVSYESPLSGEPIRGRDHVIRFLNVYLPVIKDVQTVRHIADGDYVATVWQAETSFGPLSLIYLFRVETDKIAEIKGFYDPRGFLEKMGMWTGA
jgi:limonene-1,2-epoxide hydrolase